MKRMKRVLCPLLVCMLLLSTSIVAVHGAKLPFTDVKSRDWYANAVTYVYENNLMSGLSETSFAPESNLTRAMFVTILGRMDGVNTSLYGGSSFSDVPAGQWYSAYVKWASQKGIVSGYTSTYFGANENITREQMATMISRYLNIKGIALSYADDRVDSFSDSNAVSTWARKGVEMMRRTGIIRGNANGLFQPKNAANRAEAATVFMKLKKAITTGVASEPAFVQASQIQEYKGTTYTVLNMYSNTNMVQIPNGNYLMYLAVYENKIYYTEDCGTGGGPTSLYRMNLDGTNKTKLLSNIDSLSTFCIYDDVLYYTETDWESNYYSRSIDLNNLKVQSEPYFYRFGTEHVWIISDSVFYDGNYYCSSPEYFSVQELPDGSYWTDNLVTDVYDDTMYYFMKYSVMKSSIYDKEKTTLGVGPYIEDYFILGNGLYYMESDDAYCSENDDHLLHRLDLKSGIETKFDVSDFMHTNTSWGEMYSFWPLEEVDNKLYFTTYVEDSSGLNTKCYELDLGIGKLKEVGLWFES